MKPRDQLWIDPETRSRLTAAGLGSVPQILARSEGDIAAWSRTTDTLRVAGTADAPGYFVKRYYYQRWRKRVRGALRGTFLGVHRAAAEAAALRRLRRLSIPAVRPVAVGARRVGGFVTTCFLITEEIPDARNLTGFARATALRPQTLSPATRHRLVTTLATLVARMHRANFAHGQLFWRNILVRISAEHRDPEFFLLDADPPRRWLRPRPVWMADELGCLLASALPFTTRADRHRFLRHYLAQLDDPLDIRALSAQASSRAAAHRRHETRRIRMNDLFEGWSAALADETTDDAAPSLDRGTP